MTPSLSQNTISTDVGNAAGARLAPLSLRRSFSWTLFGNLVFAGCQWACLVLLAKLGSPDLVGAFVLAMSITAPVLLLVSLKLRQVAATDAANEYAFTEYLSLTAVSCMLGVSVVLGIALLGTHSTSTGYLIIVVGLGKAIDVISETYYGLFQKHERTDLISKALILNGVLSLLGLGLGVFLSGDILWGAIGYSLASLLTLVVYNLPHAKLFRDDQKTSPAASAGTARRLAMLGWTALPLGLAATLVSLTTNVPRYFVANHLGEYALGIFAAMSYLMVAGRTVMTALAQAALPRLSKYHAAGDSRAFSRLMWMLVLFGAGLGLIAVLIGLMASQEILTFIYTPEYAEHSDVFLCLMVTMGFVFVGGFLDCGISAARKFPSKLLINGTVLVAMFATSAIAVPQWGMLGAAVAIAVARLLQLVLKAWVLVRVVGDPLSAAQG